MILKMTPKQTLSFHKVTNVAKAIIQEESSKVLYSLNRLSCMFTLRLSSNQRYPKIVAIDQVQLNVELEHRAALPAGLQN